MALKKAELEVVSVVKIMLTTLELNKLDLMMHRVTTRKSKSSDLFNY